jgi:hypothetical protein
MNFKIASVFSLMLIPIIASCTPGQINEAIEACKGDPACFEIVDEAIEEELGARGITGGRMTNIEMNRVSEFLETFTIGDGDNQLNARMIQTIEEKNYYLKAPSSLAPIMTSLENLMNDFYNMNNTQLIPSLESFDIPLINEDTTQLFYTGTGFDRVKHLLYKTGDDVFTYEIYGEEAYIFNIQLELDSLFFRDKRYISPLSIYQYFEENYPWDSIFMNNQVTISTEWFTSTYVRTEVEDGVFLQETGFNNYYDIINPLINLSFTENSSGIIYRIGIGSGGDAYSFATRITLSIATPLQLNGLNTEYSYNVLAVEVEETMIGASLVVDDWLAYALVSDYDQRSQLGSYTQASMVNTFKTIFANYLDQPFVLDPITF